MELSKIIAPNSLRSVAGRLLHPITELSPELLAEIDRRIGSRERTRYHFDEWYKTIDTEGASRWLRCSPADINVVIFNEPVAGRWYRFMALKRPRATDADRYQIWELAPPKEM